ncbi:hypothetical protein GCM10010377_70650 [Streptomyces viridiviolaceus]|nr:hypothetical protein GCM10010377_70650 [Streptomyces viridiviolaceus]
MGVDRWCDGSLKRVYRVHADGSQQLPDVRVDVGVCDGRSVRPDRWIGSEQRPSATERAACADQHMGQDAWIGTRAVAVNYGRRGHAAAAAPGTACRGRLP